MESVKKKEISTFKIAAAYIGTIIGAGFATGQEMLQFFLKFGYLGIIGIIVTTTLFIYFGIIIMDIGRELKADSYQTIIRKSGGKYLGPFIDIIILFFLFGGLTAMIAGTGALFQEQFVIPEIIGFLLMATITVITVLTGFNGIINAISYVVPFLLVAILGMSIYSVVTSPPVISDTAVLRGTGGLMGNWLFSAILYVSYNTILSIAVLGPLGKAAKDSKTIRRGALTGGLGLGFGLLMIYFALAGNVESIRYLEVPMIFIAGRISNLVVILFAIVLIAEVYTTAVGALFGLVNRMTELSKTKDPVKALKRKRTYTIIAAVAAVGVSPLGFSNLVKYLYPLVGYAGFVLLISLIIKKYRNRSKPFSFLKIPKKKTVRSLKKSS